MLDKCGCKKTDTILFLISPMVVWVFALSLQTIIKQFRELQDVFGGGGAVYTFSEQHISLAEILPKQVLLIIYSLAVPNTSTSSILVDQKQTVFECTYILNNLQSKRYFRFQKLSLVKHSDKNKAIYKLQSFSNTLQNRTNVNHDNQKYNYLNKILNNGTEIQSYV